MKNLREICKRLDATEMLAQLAEEATELAKAALKLRRATMGVNPTPVTPSKAQSDLLEEIADVRNCIAAVSYELQLDNEAILQIEKNKRKRWADRLEGKA